MMLHFNTDNNIKNNIFIINETTHNNDGNSKRLYGGSGAEEDLEIRRSGK